MGTTSNEIIKKLNYWKLILKKLEILKQFIVVGEIYDDIIETLKNKKTKEKNN